MNTIITGMAATMFRYQSHCIRTISNMQRQLFNLRTLLSVVSGNRELVRMAGKQLKLVIRKYECTKAWMDDLSFLTHTYFRQRLLAFLGISGVVLRKYESRDPLVPVVEQA